MTKLFAQVRCNSNSRSRVVEVSKDLTQAKKQAAKEFNGEFNYQTIVILDQMGNVVSKKSLNGRKWHDAI